MKLFDKIKWILGILIVFVLIAATNLIDRSNFVQVRESVETIYQDRLIAKDLILDIYKAVQEKEIALITSDANFFEARNSILNEEMKQLLESFEHTRQTENEQQVFGRLKENYNALVSKESKLVSNDFSDSRELLELVRKLEGDLYALSDIQISEGSRLLSVSKRATDSVEFFTQLEIGILILLAILIQIIILYQPKKE
ncbi:MCP four helix bundle domain-containing protein [Roseivirga sp.]|uniref:MCP four helix bundle domain-containing protein n=1 Tax=Roseivirga sp. TaxID=1964215 RepID=UPI003B52B3AC